FFVGLDLGKSHDPSALCVIQRTRQAPAWQYQCRHLHRWPLQTGYPAIIADLGKLIRKLPAPKHPDDDGTGKWRPGNSEPESYYQAAFRPNVMLCVDVTGVGLGVFDFIREAKLPCQHYPVLIVSGRQITTDERSIHHIPKVELVSVTNK